MSLAAGLKLILNFGYNLPLFNFGIAAFFSLQVQESFDTLWLLYFAHHEIERRTMVAREEHQTQFHESER
jgi:hypothetical protein